jgi:receptor expression-enhancing protein 5/6
MRPLCVKRAWEIFGMVNRSCEFFPFVSESFSLGILFSRENMCDGRNKRLVNAWQKMYPRYILTLYFASTVQFTLLHYHRLRQLPADRFKELEMKTGYSKVYFFVAALSLLSSLLYLLGGIKLVSDLVTFLYPAYASFKAIDSAKPGEDTQWLTYWVVFAFFSIVESCMYILVSWIPMYFALKMGLFLWLYHPNFMGAGLIYQQVIRPVVIPYLQKQTTPTVQKKTT